MPKQIKKEIIKPYDKKYRISAVAGMGITTIFTVAVIVLMKKLVETEGKLPAVLLFCAYVLYIISCSVSLFFGIKAYLKEDNTADLFQSFFEIYALIACTMNMRFMFILLFSAFKLNAADSLLGSQTQSEFIKTQYVCWVCMAAAAAVTFILGILAVIKLAKNK